jgi:cation diffusion facilitator CzcD-associated flavoprotein CzcO
VARQAPAIVVGAGPAGLATAGCLRRAGIPFRLLEAEREIAPRWREHYERLHLHTAKGLSALPHVPWPRSTPTYPSRAEVVSYLQRYAHRFAIGPQLGCSVRAIRRGTRGWHVETSLGALESPVVVVATGYNRVPKVPDLPGRERFRGQIVHSSGYKRGTPWRGRDVLVVGIGNSGAEIALDLWEAGARPAVAVRSPVHVLPRDPLGVPSQAHSLFVLSRLPRGVADRLALSMAERHFGDLTPSGLRRPSIGPVSQIVERGRVPLIDVGTIELIRQGQIEVLPGVAGMTEHGVRFDDGRERSFELVVCATGYDAALGATLDEPSALLDDRGLPRHYGSESPDAPGLWFVGFRNPPTGQLHDIAREASRVARQMASRRIHG